MQGRIIKATGSWYDVSVHETGKVYACRIKGKFRLVDQRVNNPVAAGDEVIIALEEDGLTGIVQEILPRRNYILRSSTRRKHQLHLIACNVDQVFLVASVREPTIKPGFIDRYLLTTENYQIPTVLVFNKCDIYNEGDWAVLNEIKKIYEPLGYRCLTVSANTGEGVEALRDELKGKTTLISGNSGVGKSSLLNSLLPNLEQRTGVLSGYTGKGQHTTTFAEIFMLGETQEDGTVIDTPGIKELGFINLEALDVAHNYPEFFGALGRCRFHDCLHLEEPGCAVQEDLEAGKISPLRYQSYCSIMDEVKEQKYHEKKLDW